MLKKLAEHLIAFVMESLLGKLNFDLKKKCSWILIFFSQENIVIGELYALQVGGRPDDSDWSGALRLGVTTIDPSSLASNLPKYACPDLITKDGFWARPIKEELIKNKAR